MLVPRQRISERFEGCGVRPRRLLILGSTGSIGESTLEIVRRNRQRFEVLGLVGGSNAAKLAQQINEFKPRVAALADKSQFAELKSKLTPDSDIEIVCGEDEIEKISASLAVDLVVGAITGSAGLRGVLAALSNGRRVALANKESLVAGGKLVSRIAADKGVDVVPIDSEHSAIFQALQGEFINDIDRLILTASGGPFRQTAVSEFKNITPDQALKHPNWSMGRKVTIDSASMMNKALELIEAHWLFGVAPTNIDVTIHPQSIVHSLVQFIDGAQIAQLSLPDMKGAISFAIAYPEGRVAGSVEQLDLAKIGRLEFERLDDLKFPAVGWARDCIKAGGFAPALFSLANEIAVEAFLGRQIRFDQINTFVHAALQVENRNFENLNELLELESAARARLKAALH